MYLVKSCSKEFNIANSGTIKIGTLHEYRETESSQILDREEGFFSIIFDLKDKYIETNIFNLLNYSHDSYLTAQVKHLHIKDKYQDYIKVTYDAEYTWVNNNRFIFCISKLENHQESRSIFSDYDDYWYISLFKKNQLMTSLENAVFEDVKKRIIDGEVVFQKSNIDLNKLTIKSHSQDILYSNRSLYLDNKKFDSKKAELIGLFQGIKYLKPDTFKKEFEFRIIFDFYENQELLIPIVKSLIIKENISQLIKQPKSN